MATFDNGFKLSGGVLSFSHLGYQGLDPVFFQALVDVPCSDLARELSENPLQTQRLQGSLQETLDRREEERQSRQLLELYLQATKREDQAASTAEGKKAIWRSTEKEGRKEGRQ